MRKTVLNNRVLNHTIKASQKRFKIIKKNNVTVACGLMNYTSDLKQTNIDIFGMLHVPELPYEGLNKQSQGLFIQVLFISYLLL